jgi:hypothetical protein
MASWASTVIPSSTSPGVCARPGCRLRIG